MRGKKSSLLVLEDEEILEHAPLGQTNRHHISSNNVGSGSSITQRHHHHQDQQERQRPRGNNKKAYHHWLERIVSSRFVSFFTCNEIHYSNYFQDAIQAGAPKAVVQTMKQFPHNARIQRMGCGALRDMSLDTWAAKEKVIQAGGVDAILKAMRIHVKDCIVQQAACQCLYTLTAGDAPRVLLEKGAVSAVLQTMDYHADDEDVLPDACDCLLALTDQQNQEALQMVRQRLGGVALAKMEHKYRGRNGAIAQKAGELLRRIYL